MFKVRDVFYAPPGIGYVICVTSDACHITLYIIYLYVGLYLYRQPDQ